MKLIVFALLLAALPSPAADRLLPLTVRQVQVGGEIGRRIDVTLRNNTLVLKTDQEFIAPFQRKDQKGGYIGLGKLLMSTVRLAAYSNDSQALALKNHLVESILALQEADGYVGMFTPPNRVTGLWDVHEVGYVIAGLLTDYEYFQSQPSLGAARKAADYVIANWGKLPAQWGEQTGVAPHVAVTGIERTFLALHRATRDDRYLDFVRRQRALAEWDLPPIVGRRAGIEGHIYAFMARSLAQLELFRLNPEPRLLAQSQRALDFFTAHDGLAITGGAGQWEIFTDDQDGRGNLAESCATAYQLRLYDSLLRLQGNAAYGDLMERTIHNTLFAAQSPDGRQIRYYSPTEGPRTYHPGDTYCCPGNYRRIISELPEMIYYRVGAGVAINLYTASEAKLEAGGVPVRIRQETSYPATGIVAIYLDPQRPVRFPVSLRIPGWARGATIQINGNPHSLTAAPGAYSILEREWQAGDVIQITMPMQPRLVLGRQRQAGRVAVMRGPQVFCLNPAQDRTLANLDAAELGRYALDPQSLAVVADHSVHPNGVAIRAGAWKPGYGTAPKHDLVFTLTEFADPNGQATYFKLRDLAPAVPDELVRTIR